MPHKAVSTYVILSKFIQLKVKVLQFCRISNSTLSKAAVWCGSGKKAILKSTEPLFLSSDMVLINIRKYSVPGCQVLRNDTVPSNMFLILVD